MANYLAPLSLILAMIFSILGQVFLKSGAVKVHFAKFIETVVLNYPLILGLFFFVVSTAFYVVALRKIPVSIAYPTAAISYVAIAVASYYFLGETLSLVQILGLTLVCVGVALMWVAR